MLGIVRRALGSDTEGNSLASWGVGQPSLEPLAHSKRIYCLPQAAPPSPRALCYSLIHLIERLLDQARNLSKGKRGEPGAIWLPAHLSFQVLADNSISALEARLGLCMRGRGRRRKWGEEAMRPDTGGELRLSGPGVGPVRGSPGQERLWQWQGVAKAEGMRLRGAPPS